jgi:hypothetical protein
MVASMVGDTVENGVLVPPCAAPEKVDGIFTPAIDCGVAPEEAPPRPMQQPPFKKIFGALPPTVFGKLAAIDPDGVYGGRFDVKSVWL